MRKTLSACAAYLPQARGMQGFFAPKVTPLVYMRTAHPVKMVLKRITKTPTRASKKSSMRTPICICTVSVFSPPPTLFVHKFIFCRTYWSPFFYLGTLYVTIDACTLFERVFQLYIPTWCTKKTRKKTMLFIDSTAL